MSWIISPAFAEEAPAEGTAATLAHGGAAEGGHEGSFPPFDSSTFPSQLFWLAIVFAVLYRLMEKRIIPQISGIIAARAERLSSDLGEAEAARAKTDAAISEYEAALAAAKARAGAVAARARGEAAKAADRRRAAAEAQLQQKLTTAEIHIDDVKKVAMAQVSAIAADTTEAVIEQLIGPVAKAEVTAAVAVAEKS